MELIPGLPDDMALDCLIRTHHSDFSSISSVSKSWNHQLHHSDFFRLRKISGNSRIIIAMAQAVFDPEKPTRTGSKTHGSPPVYKLTLLEPETGDWAELPPPPGYADGLPMFCKLVSVGSELVLLGGWDPKTFGVSRSVFVYNFITATWKCGAHMPEPDRSFFSCAMDYTNGVVYVAGGHDEEKNALRSVLSYDVAKDEWTRMADMVDERDECHAVFLCGKLHVIGGYCSDMQGRFEKSAEVLNTEIMQWENVMVDFLDVATCHKSCTVNGSDLYTCRDGQVAVKNGEGKWINVTELPRGVGEVAYVANWEEKMFVVGRLNGGEVSSGGYVLDLKTFKWSKVEMVEKYSGSIQTGCCLEL